MTRPTLDPPAVRSGTQLGPLLGVNKQRISQLRRDPQWRWAGPPWTMVQVEQMRLWLQRRREDNPNPRGLQEPPDAPVDVRRLGVERQAKLKWLLTRIARLEKDIAEREGKFILRQEVERQTIARIGAVRRALSNVGPLVEAIDRADTRDSKKEAALQWARNICDQFSGAAVAEQD